MNAQREIANQQLDVANQQLNLSQQQFNWLQSYSQQELDAASQQYAQQYDLQQQALQIAQQNAAAQNALYGTENQAAQQQLQWAQQDRQRYQDVFVPLQDQYIAQAQQYGSKAYQDQAASQAIADTQAQADQQQQNAAQQLRSMGIDPSQVQSASLMQQLGVTTAASAAGNANAARQNAINTGNQMLASAINLGQQTQTNAQNAASGSAQSANSASSASNSAISGYGTVSGIGLNGLNALGGALGNVASVTGSPTQWASLANGNFGNAASSLGQAGNILNSGYQNQLAGWNASSQASSNTFNSILGAAGTAAGIAMLFAEGGTPEQQLQQQYALPLQDLRDDYTLPQQSVQVPADVPDVNAQEAQINRSGLAAGAQSVQDRQDRNNILGAIQLGLRALQRPAPQAQMPQYGSVIVPERTQFMAEGGASAAAGAAGGRAIPTGRTPGTAFAVPQPQQRDQFHAILGGGEYVVPADVVHSKGLEFFDNLVKKYHRAGA